MHRKLDGNASTSRRSDVVGFQGKAQLEVIYGHLAEVLLSQPATSIYLKTEEPNAGEWVSKAIGKVEIESLKETHFDGSRSRRNFALDRLQSDRASKSW
jgi:type IV secretory pathway TraG/TraD family ATPase VirD4